MQERVLKTHHGQFKMAAWDGQNSSGIAPLCDKVLVLVDEAMTKSAGGIIMTDTIAEAQTLSSTTGIMIALGHQAFLWDSDRSTKWVGEKPEPGVRVYFQRYAGQEYTGTDGRMYRLMQDRSIAGVDVAPAVAA